MRVGLSASSAINGPKEDKGFLIGNCFRRDIQKRRTFIRFCRCILLFTTENESKQDILKSHSSRGYHFTMHQLMNWNGERAFKEKGRLRSRPDNFVRCLLECGRDKLDT